MEIKEEIKNRIKDVKRTCLDAKKKMPKTPKDESYFFEVFYDGYVKSLAWVLELMKKNDK